jgi:hypothetical protein
VDRHLRIEAIVRATLGALGSVLLVVVAIVQNEWWYWLIALAVIAVTVLVVRSTVQLLRE